MDKNLIIGAFTNYNYNQLKPWVESIDRCGFTGDKVMVVGDAAQETVDELEKKRLQNHSYATNECTCSCCKISPYS